jgi:sialate O-acetylesterase
MRRPHRNGLLVAKLTLSLLGCAAAARGDVTLPAVIGDHMVLQRGMPITIWGWASPGEDVTVAVADLKGTVKTDTDGKWTVKLPELQAGGQTLEMTIAGKNTIKLSDILVGEVWFGSGQSNMQWSVQQSANSKEEIAAANYPQIRIFSVPLVPAGKPAKTVNASWQVCTPQTVPGFSAVCYFFGREIHKALDVPVGMIGTSWGGTRIEPWIPPAGFASQPELQGERDQIKAMQTNYQNALKATVEPMKAWVAAAEASAAAGQDIPDPPVFPQQPFNSNGAPTGLYNGMIHPLVPFAVRGALWYQGESNLGQGMHYHALMKGLIQGWRDVWGQGDFPFLYVQLAPFVYGPVNVTALPEIWEAQAATLSFPNTGMVVTTDISTIRDIHPPNKQEVARRLALWALAKTYGKTDVVFSGPTYESMSVENDQVKIKFKPGHGVLKARDGNPLSWFSIAGADKKFVSATATIEGEMVVVKSPQVPAPVAVRFGWHQAAEPNLCNQAGLPALPFRTDSWGDAVSAEPPAG